MNPEIIHQAIKCIRETQKSFKSHSRVHLETAEDNTHRLRALENGICKKCDNLKLEFDFFDGHTRVSLRCNDSQSPLKLYRETPLGKEAKCKQFKTTE